MLSIVIPLNCEGSHLRASLATVRRHLQTVGLPYEFVLVDDGSTDGTWEVIRGLCDEFPQVRALRLSRNFGKEAALSAGLEAARGDAVIVIDGDLQHPPGLIPEMVRLWSEEGIDVVDAVKQQRAAELLPRRCGSRLFSFLMRKLSGFDLSGASDFKLLDRKVVDAWLRLEERQLFYRGMIEWLGFSHARIPFEVDQRTGGASRWSMIGLFWYAVTALTSFSSLPLHIVTLTGGSFLLVAVTLGCWSLVRWALGTAIGGFTTVILLQLFIGSILMVSLGIIGQYLAHIYAEVKRRPRYVVAERICENVTENQQPAMHLKAAG